jgi:pimeloyl-ACP methyl ester carboxylesterase
VSRRKTQTIQHGKVRLALHTLRGEGTGHPLLLLHGLGEQSPQVLPNEFQAWKGPVYALDFTGHGESQCPFGGGYTAEILMADTDAALAEIGPSTICGRGLGAYVALLIAGGRPSAVLGAILCDGPGLTGGGPQPGSPHIIHPDPRSTACPDSFALAEFCTDVRPPDYAQSFVRQIDRLSRVERPLTVCAVQRAPWLDAVVNDPETETRSLHEALDAYSEPGLREVDPS